MHRATDCRRSIVRALLIALLLRMASVVILRVSKSETLFDSTRSRFFGVSSRDFTSATNMLDLERARGAGMPREGRGALAVLPPFDGARNANEPGMRGLPTLLAACRPCRAQPIDPAVQRPVHTLDLLLTPLDPSTPPHTPQQEEAAMPIVPTSRSARLTMCYFERKTTNSAGELAAVRSNRPSLVRVRRGCLRIVRERTAAAVLVAGHSMRRSTRCRLSGKGSSMLRQGLICEVMHGCVIAVAKAQCRSTALRASKRPRRCGTLRSWRLTPRYVW